MLGHALLDGVRDDRRQQCAYAGDEAAEDADERPARDRHRGFGDVLAGQHPGSDPCNLHAPAPGFEVVQDLADAVQAHDDRHEFDAFEQLCITERHARGTIDEVGSRNRQRQSEERADEPEQRRPSGKADEQGHAHHHQAEEFRRPEFQRDACKRRRRDDQESGGDRPADERADGRNRQCRTRAALLGHLVAVDRGHGGGRLARHLHEHAGHGAAVHRAVIDRAQHDDGAGRIEVKRERQQDADRGDRADPRQHADGRADERPDEGEQQIVGPQRDAEAEHQTGPRIQDDLPAGETN